MSLISGVSSVSYDLWQILTAQAQTTAPSSSGSSTSTSTSNTSSTNALDPFANLNLTSDQQQQIEQIYQDLQSGSITPSLAQSQINAALTPQQQQTLQADLQSLQTSHPHHHPAGPPDGTSLLSGLGLTSEQLSKIAAIIQSAQSSGSSASDLLNQIDSVLTTSQQQQIVSEFAGASSNAGSSSISTPSYLINTTT